MRHLDYGCEKQDNIFSLLTIKMTIKNIIDMITEFKAELPLRSVL